MGVQTPRRVPSVRNLTASTIKPVGPLWLQPQRPLIANPGIAPERIRPSGIYALQSVFSSGAHPSARIGPVMNVLSRDQQIAIIACLSESQSIRATERINGIHRDTVMRLGSRWPWLRRTARPHDGRHPHGPLGAGRDLGLCRQEAEARPAPRDHHKADQYTFIAMSASAKGIIRYRTGKRDSENTDLRERILGVPEISTDGFHPYKNAIRDAFAGRAHHGVIGKTYRKKMPRAATALPK